MLFWREIIRAYSFPLVMFLLAIIPVLNFTYSGHGGPSWLILPLCFPCVVLRAIFKIAKGSEESRKWFKRFYKITLPSYIVLALPLSWAATTSIRTTFGLTMSAWKFFVIMISPFPWWYFA